MARNVKSSVKAERADRRQPPDERLDRDSVAGLLPLEELDRPANSRLTAGDLKRATAKAKSVMGTSKKLDPGLNAAASRSTAASSSTAAAGARKSRGATDARQNLDKGSVKMSGSATDGTRRSVTKTNAEIAEGVTSTARKSPAPRTARADAAGGVGLRSREINKRTGSARQRAPAPGNVVNVPKRAAVTGQKEAKRTGIRSTSSTGGARPPKASARGGRASGASRARGAHGNTIE